MPISNICTIIICST
uniref:Uncharacterized protein n=1 Tax=Arundo donax TaxID=35708 RepID=A0A0A9ACZ2_ARUDO